MTASPGPRRALTKSLLPVLLDQPAAVLQSAHPGMPVAGPCDHLFLRIQSLIDARSSGSTPGGRPPSTVTHRMRDRAAGSPSRSPRNSRRRPPSTRARSVVRDSTACLLAATTRSRPTAHWTFVRARTPMSISAVRNFPPRLTSHGVPATPRSPGHLPERAYDSLPPSPFALRPEVAHQQDERSTRSQVFGSW